MRHRGRSAVRSPAPRSPTGRRPRSAGRRRRALRPADEVGDRGLDTTCPASPLAIFSTTGSPPPPALVASATRAAVATSAATKTKAATRPRLLIALMVTLHPRRSNRSARRRLRANTSELAPRSDCGQHGCGRRQGCHNRVVAILSVRRANIAPARRRADRARLRPRARSPSLGVPASSRRTPGIPRSSACSPSLPDSGSSRSGWFRRPAGRSLRIGDLALLAGFVWFAPIWVGWDDGPPLVRSLGDGRCGFRLRSARPPRARLPERPAPARRLARLLVVAVYLEATVSAIGRALFRDPFLDANAAGTTARTTSSWSILSPARARDPDRGPLVRRRRRGRAWPPSASGGS